MLGGHSARTLVSATAALVIAGAAVAAGNQGKIGDTLTVKGRARDILAVTLLRLQDPVKGYDVGAGKRVIGVTFEVKNVGKGKYEDFPTALLTTRDGESSGSAISTGGSCRSPSAIRLEPGQSKRFCLPFEVAKKAHVMTIQYEPDGGYGTPAVFVLKK